MFSRSLFLFSGVVVLLTSGFVAAAPVPVPEGGSAYTGPGGQANGGNVYKSSSGLINLDVLNIGSGNAGSGGTANSGSAVGGDGCGNGSGGSAYTGPGGQANGGNVYEYSHGGLINLKALNIGSGNAGEGGSANSGSSYGGDAGCGRY